MSASTQDSNDTMLALSIRQPWPWAILHADKDVENRGWLTKFRGRILLHAGKQMDPHGLAMMREVGLCPPDDLARGGIVGSVEITDCVTYHPSPWFFGPYGFVLRDPRPLPFRPARGKLGFFKVSFRSLYPELPT